MLHKTASEVQERIDLITVTSTMTTLIYIAIQYNMKSSINKFISKN